jgi:hypothetical protein
MSKFQFWRIIPRMEDWKSKLKLFLASLSVMFAVQVTFELDSDYDGATVFLKRLFVGSLVAAAVTFFWGKFRKNRVNEKQ